ncbi:hypothetical protein [Novosphingobium percolationis]|uniref:hypothetical protein n=1 Tax=Novosphingobium percolationis TaxID=2871811 RepID=UPI001CD69FB3|nr:hypothetical protein [Novosphingobium percolationis]
MLTLAVLILFWLMLLGNFAVAALFGTRIERAFATMLVVISIVMLAISVVVPPPLWARAGTASDWAILVVAWFLALRSDRYWPIWFAAMQSLAIITSTMAAMVTGVPHVVFSNLAAVWALPALLVMSAGTLSDWSARRRST